MGTALGIEAREREREPALALVQTNTQLFVICALGRLVRKKITLRWYSILRNSSACSDHKVYNHTVYYEAISADLNFFLWMHVGPTISRLVKSVIFSRVCALHIVFFRFSPNCFPLSVFDCIRVSTSQIFFLHHFFLTYSTFLFFSTFTVTPLNNNHGPNNFGTIRIRNCLNAFNSFKNSPATKLSNHFRLNIG